MMMVTQLSTLPLVQALGWALLHFLWQGALVALLLAVVLGIIPQAASRMRYAAACTAMALMVLLPLITFAILTAEARQGTPRFPVDLSAGNSISISAADLRQPAESWAIRCEKALDHSMPWVIAFWLAGIIVLLFRLNLGLLGARKLKFLGVEPASVELQGVLQRLRVRLGIRRPVKLLNSIRVQVPTVIGWLRPAVLIPIGCIAGLSSAQIEAILAHELAHIRRHDYLVSLFQCVIETVLFYHPAVWWISNRIRRERENCCDDLAVGISGDRLAYAKALTFLEAQRGPAPAGAMAATGGVLKMRIARLLGVNENPVFPRTAAVILLAVAGAVAGLAVLQAARAQSAPEQKPQEKPLTFDQPGSYYKQWLNQDVRWIITPEEKQAFLRLTNDRERDEFIRQFWEHRNPDPGSPGNKFKQEHYRRIAYANQHFVQSGEPGWATDRGHVYIVFGRASS
jgi:GWxTD domain-containing protein